MQPEFHGKLRSGFFSFNRLSVWEAYLKGLPDGEYFVNIHKRKGAPKTPEQLAYYYAVVVPTAYNQMVADGNDSIIINTGNNKFKEIPLTKVMVDKMLKQIWAKAKDVEVKSKSKFTIEEASELIDISIRWCARYLHCVIPPPDTEQ